uniref:SCP domain-containing protein n=2 Tax=Phytophthora ramorum TaxID=164328 RepID=H3GX02_PHYRM
MLVLRSFLAGFIVAAAVSDAAHLRQGQRHLQTYTQSDDYFSVMLDRVNQARAAEGLPALCTNKKLQNAAQEHSDDQAANNYLDHEGTDGTNIEDRVAQAGYDWTSVAENIAAGQPNVDSVMNTWMNSPGHRENILGDYTNFGVAYAYNADSKFQHYWTQDFGTGDTEECDGVASEPENKIAHLIASSEAIVMEDTPLMATATETLPQSEGSWSSSQETDAPVVVEDPIAIETLSGTDEEEYASQRTDAPATELPEATPVVVVDPLKIGTPAPEKVYKTHDTPHSATGAPDYKHKDCDSGL